MAHEIDLSRTHSKQGGNFLCRPFFTDGAIENLEMFGRDFFLQPRHCGCEQIFLPLPFPQFVKTGVVGVGHPLDRNSSRIVPRTDALMWRRRTLPKLISNTPASDVQ